MHLTSTNTLTSDEFMGFDLKQAIGYIKNAPSTKSGRALTIIARDKRIRINRQYSDSSTITIAGKSVATRTCKTHLESVSYLCELIRHIINKGGQL